MSISDVTIIGAGITGCSAAYNLAAAGCSVTVIDRYGPAAMASGWTLAGVRQSGRHLAELPLALHAVVAWPNLAEVLEAPTDYRQNGNLRVARSEGEVAVIREMVAEQSRAGLDLRMIEGSEAVRDIAPALSDSLLAASFCPSDGHADPLKTVAAFQVAAERLGATFRFGERVIGIDVVGGRVQAVRTDRGALSCATCIAAPGIAVNEVLISVGHAIPLRTPMVAVVQTASLPPLLAPVLGAANANCAGRQQVDGCLRVTSGGNDWHGAMYGDGEGRVRVDPTAASVARTISNVGEVLPALLDAPISRVWGGLLDLTPDALPVIDHVPGCDGLIVAAGFSGHGFGIAPATGELLHDLTLGLEPRLAIDAFRFDRFSDATGSAADVELFG